MPMAVCITDHDIILSTDDQLTAYGAYAVSTRDGLL